MGPGARTGCGLGAMLGYALQLASGGAAPGGRGNGSIPGAANGARRAVCGARCGAGRGAALVEPPPLMRGHPLPVAARLAAAAAHFAAASDVVSNPAPQPITQTGDRGALDSPSTSHPKPGQEVAPEQSCDEAQSSFARCRGSERNHCWCSWCC